MTIVKTGAAGAQRAERIVDTRPVMARFFGWMSLAIFGVALPILGRRRALMGADLLEALRRD